MAISQKETNETIYWMELLVETNFVTMDQFESINNDAIDIIKLLTASIKTAKGLK
jgi:four helix bundle protein